MNDSAQLKRLVPFTQFATDLAGDSLPNYSFVVPNLCNDAHDCSLQTADTWLQTNIAPLVEQRSFQTDGLLVIAVRRIRSDDKRTAGAASSGSPCPKAKPGFTSAALYQHESTLRLMAEGLGLTSFPGGAATRPTWPSSSRREPTAHLLFTESVVMRMMLRRGPVSRPDHRRRRGPGRLQRPH